MGIFDVDLPPNSASTWVCPVTSDTSTLQQDEIAALRAKLEQAEADFKQMADENARIMEQNINLTERAEQAEARVRELEQEVASERQACLCGCPMADHDNGGEDGIQCQREDHECIPAATVVTGAFTELRADRDRLQRVVDRMRELAIEYCDEYMVQHLCAKLDALLREEKENTE